MKKLVTLQCLRRDGFQTETFEDDFVMDVPEELIKCFNPNKAIQYCEKMFPKPHTTRLPAPTAKRSLQTPAVIIIGAIAYCMRPRISYTQLAFLVSKNMMAH